MTSRRTSTLPFFFCALALALLPAARPAAAERVLTLDPQASRVTFLLPATGHDVAGAFQVRSGVVRFDPETGAAGGEIVVEARGAETGNGSRDKTMHQKVLESERFPTFVFRPRRMQGEIDLDGTSEVALVGKMAIHGGEFDTTMKVKVTVSGQNVEAEATFPVPFKAWGMEDPSILFLKVADEVAVTVHAVGSLGEQAAAQHDNGNAQGGEPR